MREIRMVDLQNQYLKIKPEVDNAIQSVMDSAAFINGPEVKAFATELADYLGVKHVIPCGNGTDALQVAMMAHDLKPGDEVITPDFTFIATVEVIGLLGLKPVLADVDPNTFNLDPESVRKAITPRTKAIVPVHLFGQPADMDAIMQIAREHDLLVIEDNAQALGADYTDASDKVMKAGAIGHSGCTSFFPSKNLGAFGDAGAVFTNDDKLASSLRSVVNHGMTVRYYHDRLGVNSRLDSIQAAILRIKLRHLNEYNEARKQAAAFYDQVFADESMIKTPYCRDGSSHIYHQYTLVLDKKVNRDKLRNYLEENKIPSMIYYPVPLHLQKAYESLGYSKGDFPVTEDLCNRVLSLPMHTELDKLQQEYITGHVLQYLKNNH